MIGSIKNYFLMGEDTDREYSLVKPECAPKRHGVTQNRMVNTVYTVQKYHELLS